MATFDTTIPWDAGTKLQFDLGIDAVVMEDGTADTVSHFSGAVNHVAGTVAHSAITQAEMEAVRDFHQTNAGIVFTITDPARGQAMTGKCVSGSLRTVFVDADTWDVSWEFRGVEV